MKTFQNLREEFDFTLSLDNDFGRKILTVLLLTQIGILARTIFLMFDA
jgi:hypothetical protein